MFESFPPPSKVERSIKTPIILQMLGKTALYGYTILPFNRNNPLPLFGVVEKESAQSPQLLYKDITTVAEHTREIVEDRNITAVDQRSFSDKLISSAYMVQFTDRLINQDQAFFEYNTMKTLKDSFVLAAHRQAFPLGFDQQLEIALELTHNNLAQALTNLWLTSRQYARWLDSVAISNMPALTPDEILDEMREWRSSILACKQADMKNFQDTAGDNYYAWTHARARVLYGSEPGVANRIGKFVFEHGTTLNTHIRLIKQTIPSNHKIAAAYGNRIGDTILKVVKSTS